MRYYVFFMFYIVEINPQCKGDPSCAKTSAQTIFIRRVQSHSCEWLKHISESQDHALRDRHTFFLSTLRWNSISSIPAAICPTSTLPCFSVYCRPSGLTTFVGLLSARHFRRACFRMNTLPSTGTRASIFSTRNTSGGKNPHHSSTAYQRQQMF